MSAFKAIGSVLTVMVLGTLGVAVAVRIPGGKALILNQ